MVNIELEETCSSKRYKIDLNACMDTGVIIALNTIYLISDEINRVFTTN